MYVHGVNYDVKYKWLPLIAAKTILSRSRGRQLLEQWQERLMTFLVLKKEDVGILKGDIVKCCVRNQPD